MDCVWRSHKQIKSKKKLRKMRRSIKDWFFLQQKPFQNKTKNKSDKQNVIWPIGHHSINILEHKIKLEYSSFTRLGINFLVSTSRYFVIVCPAEKTIIHFEYFICGTSKCSDCVQLIELNCVVVLCESIFLLGDFAQTFNFIHLIIIWWSMMLAV